MKTYPLTLAAIKDSESKQWAIGDALLIECGDPGEKGKKDGSFAALEEASKYLLSEGYGTYSSRYLAELRQTAFSFKRAERSFKVAWGAYRVAGSPEYLKSVIAGAPKGTTVSQDYVEEVRKAQRDQALRDHDAKAKQAELEREEAEEAEVKARAQEAEAEGEEEKAKAAAKTRKASSRTQKAKQKEEEARTAPVPTPGPVEPEQTPRMVAVFRFRQQATQARALAREAVQGLKDCLEQLHQEDIVPLKIDAMEVANAWSEAARVVQGGLSDQFGHLSVVGK